MDLPDSNALNDRIVMLWIMHAFADEFRQHAILKGGMQLQLMSSDRATNDLDYVFVPYGSKKEIVPRIEKLLSKIPEAKITKSLHSSSGRFAISVGHVNVQVEFNVSESMKSEIISTELLARPLGVLPKIIRVMSADVALAHKLAAWNERRLLRDLYDIYYWHAIAQTHVEIGVLLGRLGKINSRVPKMKRVKSMTLQQFLDELTNELQRIEETRFVNDLSVVIPAEKLKGLFPIFKTKVLELIASLRLL